MQQVITAKGHPNIRANHKTTWQFTKENHLTPRGDCIIGVSASHAALDLSPQLKTWLNQGNWVLLELRIGELVITGKGHGHPDLDLNDPTDMVFRRSDFLSDRTVTINTTFVAADLTNDQRALLLDPQQEIYLTISTIEQNQEHLSNGGYF